MSQRRCCVVIYPSDAAGRVSYIYGVFESEEAARAHYFQDPEPESEQPEFLNLPLYLAEHKETEP